MLNDFQENYGKLQTCLISINFQLFPQFPIPFLHRQSRAVAAEGHRDARHGGGTVGRQPSQARRVVVLCEAILGPSVAMAELCGRVFSWKNDV